MQLQHELKSGVACLLKKSTISLIKCDVGSLAGHHVVPKPLFKVAEKNLKEAAEKGVINNSLVFNAA
jgi:fructose 1,6-bisphosphatase